jgi:cell division protease FtsH
MATPNNPESSPEPRKSATVPPATWVLLVLFALFGTLAVSQTNIWSLSRPISYTTFLELAKAGKLKQVTFIGFNRVSGEVRNPDEEVAPDVKLPNGRFTLMLPPANDREPLIRLLVESHKDADPPLKIDTQEESGTWIGPLLMTLLPTLLIFGLILLFILPRLRDVGGPGFLNNYSKSPAKRYEHSKQRTTFADVADMQNAKRELQEIVEFLRAPEKFHKLGAQIPKGVLLVGPPGTGKTLLARAVAGEANVPFFNVSGSEFIQMFVGVGASRVRDLFKTARENAPCLVFIDEIDAVGRMRGAGLGGGSDEREQTLNQILTEMDGFTPSETIIVLAATNRPDVLDSALLRPGRFDRHVTIERPKASGRLEILKVHTRNKPLADDVDLERIAKSMIGMSGAELRNLCNEAAILAATENRSSITHDDFMRAADRVRLGALRDQTLTEEEKRRTAYHEAGHALSAFLEPKATPPTRVTIIPRGRAAGVTMYEPPEDRVDYSRSELEALLVTILGGRAADRLIFNEPLGGASNDLKQATRLARIMVAQLGMSDEIGPVSFRIGEEHVFLGKELAEPRDYSEGTAQRIDEEVARILRQADERAYELLQQNRDLLERFAQALLEHEELNHSEMLELLERHEPAGVNHAAS